MRSGAGSSWHFRIVPIIVARDIEQGQRCTSSVARATHRRRGARIMHA